MTTATSNPPLHSVTSDEALRIARADAERVYGDLNQYCIKIVHEPDGWHIEYELKDLTIRGGGPHYVIDATTGDIVSKKYYQ